MERVERHGLVFAVERWNVFWPDARLLWPKHYAELGQNADPVPFILLYYNMDQAGSLFIMTARTAKTGQLVGYQISTVSPHPHYAGQLCAFEDAFFLDPLFRRGRIGIDLIKLSCQFLAQRGVQKVFFHSNQRKPTDKLFKFLGFTHCHTVYSKELTKDGSVR